MLPISVKGEGFVGRERSHMSWCQSSKYKVLFVYLNQLYYLSPKFYNLCLQKSSCESDTLCLLGSTAEAAVPTELVADTSRIVEILDDVSLVYLF